MEDIKISGIGLDEFKLSENSCCVSTEKSTNGETLSVQALNYTTSVVNVETEKEVVHLDDEQNQQVIKKRKRQKLPVYKIDEAYEFQKSNVYIKTGYRKDLNALDCLNSVFCLPYFAFTIHNESVNIWTHLVATIFFLYLLIDKFLRTNYAKLSFSDMFYLDGLLVAYVIAMFTSFVYHTLNCHSKKVRKMGLLADVSGIASAILFSSLSAVYFSFYCDKEGWSHFYITTQLAFFILIVMVFFVLANSSRLPPKIIQYSQKIRTAMMMAWSASLLIPVVHWVVLSGGLQAPVVKAMLIRLVLVYVIGTASLVFYLSFFPERLSQTGKFDLIGQSHNIWHIISFIGMVYWYETMELYSSYRLSHPCSAGNGFQPNDPNAYNKLKIFPTHTIGPPVIHEHEASEL